MLHMWPKIKHIIQCNIKKTIVMQVVAHHLQLACSPFLQQITMRPNQNPTTEQKTHCISK